MERTIDSAANIPDRSYTPDPEEFGALGEQEHAQTLNSPEQPSALEEKPVGILKARGWPERLPVAVTQIDTRSALYGLTGLIGHFAFASLCLAVARVDNALAIVWLPNAAIIALLLIAQPRAVLPVYLGVALASVGTSLLSGWPLLSAPLFALSNLGCIASVTWLTKRSCSGPPNLADLSHLGYFLQFGGVVGPLIGALILAPSFGHSANVIWQGTSAHFLAESMGIMLLVPACLLIADFLRQPSTLRIGAIVWNLLITGAGLSAVYLVFNQSAYPLLFLVPPVTLLIALRLGVLGTAIFLPAAALIVCLASAIGNGPIAQSGLVDAAQMSLIQAFVAANFLTGLPVAAILAGRERLSGELGRGRRELALLTEGITDAVLLVDLDGVCNYASPSVRDVLGRQPEDLLGHRVAERTHEDARERIVAVLDNLRSGKSDKERLTYRRLLDDAKGHPVFIEADCAVVINTTTGKPSGIVMSARDVTERVELELLLTRARQSAEKAATAKSEFLANMSHEIRTPMNGVLGFAELLREADLSEENRRHADMIVQSGRSMMMLLNDILDLSKIEAGQVGIAAEPVDLFATISECAALYRPSAEKKGLKLDFSITEAAAALARSGVSESLSPWIKTDGLRLRQIVLNLVGNAIKFTEEGCVHIGVSGDKEELYISVTDTGIGISEARLQSIFAPFTQGQGDTARSYGGTGLGLSISRQLAELLGGTIDVESEAGVGSRFKLTLPATYTQAALPEVADDEPFEPSMLPQQASILLVEDHDVNRLLVTEMLERCGQSVATAHDGNEGIAMVIDSIMRGKPYDLVLMDIQMPGCDGYAATRAIRAEGITPDELPIIALTANAFPEDLAATRDAGMQAHLAKPLVFADLARALQRWLPTRIVEASDDTELNDPSLSCDEAARGTSIPSAADEDTRDHFAAEIVDISRDPDARAPMIGEAKGPSAKEEDPSFDVNQGRGPQYHSPTLLKRWEERRGEAVEAVRAALENGTLGAQGGCEERCEDLAKLIHKLAGTAAIFGEAELGDQAAALEHALRMKLPPDVREALAFELLSVADDPADTLKDVEL